MLEFMLLRLRGVQADHLVVATSALERDDPIEMIARSCGIGVVRGSEQDVLSRFIVALDQYPCETIVRLTADCPLTDPAIVNAAIALHHERGAQYTSNVLPRSFPKGLDIEVCDSTALRTAAFLAVDPAEREHVTPFLYRRPEHYVLANLRSDLDAGQERWTVDTPEDLEHVRQIVSSVGRDASWTEILAKIGRTVAQPGADELRLRAATEADSSLLLQWRNDPDAVRWSGNGRAIETAEHDQWFASVLENPGHRLRIGEVDGRPVGFVRVDVHGGVGTVSVAVAPDQRGRGYGRDLLTATLEDVQADCQVVTLAAIIHRENEASLRAFRSVGFVPTIDPTKLANQPHLNLVTRAA